MQIQTRRKLLRSLLAASVASIYVGFPTEAMAGEGCCSHCGCSANRCKKTCRLVKVDRKIVTTCWGMQCEDFCVPGPSTPDCKHCETVCSNGPDDTQNSRQTFTRPSEIPLRNQPMATILTGIASHFLAGIDSWVFNTVLPWSDLRAEPYSRHAGCSHVMQRAVEGCAHHARCRSKHWCKSKLVQKRGTGGLTLVRSPDSFLAGRSMGPLLGEPTAHAAADEKSETRHRADCQYDWDCVRRVDSVMRRSVLVRWIAVAFVGECR